ncbi:hypothetical protein WR25_00489 [Diploscapter pachys]|uniref:G-protein coupled receptors family 1 profile domain-containing protein n=1 Tax=Diploscapter pachys TaxID=2018661 RepID=A0A2A2KJH8_9BILA|nr:hypothetical protein WR25_00489 [Diploscapter pachys]
MVGNGFIIFLFTIDEKLKKNKNLRMIFLLSSTDFLFSVLFYPYSIYILVNWDSHDFDYDPLYVMIAATPFLMQLKINLILTIAIAVERNMALYFPVMYRRIDSSRYAIVTLLLSIVAGLTDVFLSFYMSKVMPRPNCPSIGCFCSCSNMFVYLFLNNDLWNLAKKTIGVNYEASSSSSHPPNPNSWKQPNKHKVRL